MKTFFKKFGEAISIVFVIPFLIIILPILLAWLAILTIVDYVKYKKTMYYVETKGKYTWLCANSAYIDFYNSIKKSDLPIDYYRDEEIKIQGYGYFVYRDILILCDFDNVIYFDSGQNEWFIYEEHGDILLKEKVEEEIKKANEFFGENRCNKAIVFLDAETFDETPEKHYENFEFLRDTDKISELLDFISRENGVPPIEQIVDYLYDKQLTFTDYEVVKAIYNTDKTKRFIILKSTNGFYKYTYEEICVCDYDAGSAYPAFWEANDKFCAQSFFGTENEALLSMKQESEYILHFDKESDSMI